MKALVRGAVGGMVASMAMAMVAMIASLTYQHHGFFTPLFHISALFGSPKSMMLSMQQAMSGNRFWFSGGPALVGLLIHMVTGAMYGMAFVMLAGRVNTKLRIPVGALYGVAVLGMSSVVLLPVAAKVTGAGSAISHMAQMVGWSTFTLEHVMFGLVLGALAGVRVPAAAGAPVATRVHARA